MKYIKWLLVTVVFSLLALSACGGTSNSGSANDSTDSANSDEVFELEINNWTPSTHHYAYNAWEPWKKLVEEKTDGRVKVNIHHGSSLGASDSVYQDVAGGLYDVSLVVANYFYDTKFFPYTIGNLPFALEGPEVADVVLEEFVQKYAVDDLDDVIVMPASSTDGYDLFATKPIRSIDDLKGLKMRVNGKSENAFVKALGGVPVSIPTEETYEGLDKGMINTTFYTPIGAVGIKFTEPAPYITKLSVAATPVVPILNKQFYESLPEDLQEIFDNELNPALTSYFSASYVKELEKSYETLKEEVSERGEFIELDDKVYEDFRELAKGAWDAWAKDADAKGYDGQAMVDDFIEILEENGHSAPF